MQEVEQEIFCQLPMCVRSFLLQRSAGEHKTGVYVLYYVLSSENALLLLGAACFF